MDLVEILKSKKDSWDLLRDLLSAICQRFPAEDTSKAGTFVRVSCSWGSHQSKAVSPYGFLFLEIVESAMSSTEQKVELVVVDHLKCRLLFALGSRLARQQGSDVETRVVVRSSIQCPGKSSASAVCSVLQHSQIVDLGPGGLLRVSEDIGRDGWTALQEALSSDHLHDIPQLDTCYKSCVASARAEDVRAIWRCLSLSWKFSGDHEVFEKGTGKDGWGALEQFLDFTQEEWRAAAKRATRRLAQVLFENREQVDLPVDMGPVDIAMDMGLQDLPMDMGPVAVPVALEPMEAEQD